MKKVFLLFPILGLTACNNVNKEELKKEIISEIKSSNVQPSVVKGCGANLYAEPVFLVRYTKTLSMLQVTSRWMTIRNYTTSAVHILNLDEVKRLRERLD